MNQLMIAVVVGIILTAAAAAVLRSHPRSTGHAVGAVSSKIQNTCRCPQTADPGYEDMSLVASEPYCK